MTAFSLGTVWEETIAFMRRESGLLLPVAFAIFGPGQILLRIAMAAAAAPQGGPASSPSPEALLILPAAVLVLFGNITISAIVLSPGISVGEALARAANGLPRALLAVLLLGLAAAAAVIVVGSAAAIGAMVFGANLRSPSVNGPLVTIMVIPMFVIMVRMLLLAPAVAMEKLGVIDTIRRTWALSRDNVLRFTFLVMLVGFLNVLLGAIETVVIGSLVELLKLVIDQPGLLNGLRMVINAAIESMLSMAMAVYVALVYRQLARN